MYFLFDDLIVIVDTMGLELSIKDIELVCVLESPSDRNFFQVFGQSNCLTFMLNHIYPLGIPYIKTAKVLNKLNLEVRLG